MESAFDRVKARYLFLWLLLATAFSVFITLVLWPEPTDGFGRDIWYDVFFATSFSGLVLLSTTLYARRAGIGVEDLFRPLPDGVRLRRLVSIAFPLIGVALVGMYVLYTPLSLVFPEAIQTWLFEDTLLFYSVESPYPVLANLIGLVSLGIVGPISEEWLFRGLLLRRWSHKWGTTKAVITSSLVFALFHTEIIGAFVFGVVMCGLYARYHTLWAPAIVHIVNNTLAGVLIVLDAHGVNVGTVSSVEQLQAAWWMPVLGAALVFPWAFRLRSRWTPLSSWRFGAPTGLPLQPTGGT